MIISIDIFHGTTKKKCTNTNTVREDYIEKYLLENLQECFDTYKAKVKTKPIRQNDSKSTQIEKIKKKINKLKDLYLDDLIDKETYEEDYKNYMKELNQLELINKTETSKRDFSKVEKILNSNYIDIYNKLTIENKKRFWLSIIDKIYVTNGKVKEITFL